MEVRFTHLGCFIEEEGRVIAQGPIDGRMFILDSTDGGTAMFVKGEKVESDIDLQSKQVVFGLPKFSGRKAQICEACQRGKQHRLPFPNERNRSQNKFDLIHSDVWGPAQNVSLGGSRYFVSFIDDYTRHTWIYLIEKKSEVFDCFRDLKGFVETESGRKIKCLRSDGGKEYFSGQFNGYLQQMEFGASSVVDTRRSRTVWPTGRIGRLWRRHGQC